MDYLQKIPQTHKPTTRNMSLTCWEWPVSCRSPTPVAILQTSLQRERETHLCSVTKLEGGQSDAWKHKETMNIKSLTSPCCYMELLPPNPSKHKTTDVNLWQSIGCSRSTVRQAHADVSVEMFYSELKWEVWVHLPNTQIQPVKKDVVCQHICYVCQGSSVHLWQYYTLGTQTTHDVNECHLYLSHQKLNFVNEDDMFWFPDIKELCTEDKGTWFCR